MREPVFLYLTYKALAITGEVASTATSDTGQAGAGLGGMIALVTNLMMWAPAALITGILSYITRGEAVYEEIGVLTKPKVDFNKMGQAKQPVLGQAKQRVPRLMGLLKERLGWLAPRDIVGLIVFGVVVMIVFQMFWYSKHTQTTTVIPKPQSANETLPTTMDR